MTSRLRSFAVAAFVVAGLTVLGLFAAGAFSADTQPPKQALPPVVVTPSPRPPHPVPSHVPRIPPHVPPALPATVSVGPPPAPTKPRPAHVAKPRPFGPSAGPGDVSLRFANNNETAYLAGPGMAIGRGNYSLTALQPLVLTATALQRPVTIDGTPFLRMHLTSSQPGDLTMTATLADVASSGSVQTIESRQISIAAGTVARGPDSNADATLDRVHYALAAHHALRLTLALSAASVGTVHVYYGALPGQDEGSSTADRNEEAMGGPNPTRLRLPVTKVAGAFVLT